MASVPAIRLPDVPMDEEPQPHPSTHNLLPLVTASPIAVLPVEILSQVFTCLPKASVRNARLTSKTWSRVGAPHLLDRLYCAPSKGSIEMFEAVTSDEVIRKGITELICDARVLSLGYLTYHNALERCKAMMNYAADTHKHHSFRNSINECTLTDVLKNHEQLYTEQVEIFKTAYMIRSLRDRVKLLQQLKKVTVLSEFVDSRKFEAFPDDDHQSYFHQSNRLFDDAILPSTASFHTKHSAWQERGWDPQAIGQFFKALENISIQEIQFGSSHGRVPISAFKSQRLCSRIARAAQHSTSLQIDFYVSENIRADCYHPGPGTIPMWLYDAIWGTKGLRIILESLPKLERLTLRGWFGPENLIRTLVNNSLPVLRELNLGKALVDADSLVSIISQYQGTLRDLSLIDVRFTEAGVWDVVAKELGQKLELRTFRVGRLINYFWGPASMEKFRHKLETASCFFMKGNLDERMQPQWPPHVETQWVDMSDGSRKPRLCALEATRRS